MTFLCFVGFFQSVKEIYFVLNSEKLNCGQPPTPPTLTLVVPYVFLKFVFWQLWPVGCAGCTDLGCFWQTNLVRNLGSNFLAGQGI